MSTGLKAIPEVEIELGGKKLKLCFSTMAFCTLEEKLKINALDSNIWTNPSVSMRTALLWAGLQTYHPEYTLEVVRSSLPLPQLGKLFEMVMEAFSRASADASEAAEKNAEAAPQETAQN